MAGSPSLDPYSRIMERLSCESITPTQVSSAFELLDASIKDGWINKQILDSRMDRAISLKKEVILKEKAAEEAKEEAAVSGLDILAKVEALKQEQQQLREANDMHARKVNASRAVLTKELKELQLRVSAVSHEAHRSLLVSDEMHKKLKSRLTEATREKELADKEKLEKEKLALETLSFEESQMLKLVEESEKLKQEEVIYTKLQDCIKERASCINNLHGDMSNIHQDINLFIECLDQPIRLLSSGQKSVDSDLEEQEGNTNAKITDVRYSVSTEESVASAQTYVEWRAYAPQTVKHHPKKRKTRRKGSSKKRTAAVGDIHKG